MQRQEQTTASRDGEVALCAGDHLETCHLSGAWIAAAIGAVLGGAPFTLSAARRAKILSPYTCDAEMPMTTTTGAAATECSIASGAGASAGTNLQ